MKSYNEIIEIHNKQVIEQRLYTLDAVAAHYASIIKIASGLIATGLSKTDCAVTLSKISEDKDDQLACGIDLMMATVHEAERIKQGAGIGRVIRPLEPEIIDRMAVHYRDGYKRGRELNCWPKLSRHFRFAGGELNILTGIPGHGKSEWLDAFLLNHAKSGGIKTILFSPENYPFEIHIQKLVEKFINMPMMDGPHTRMEPDDMRRGIDWLDRYFRFIDIGDDGLTLENILALFSNSIKRDGINCCVIDPWNTIEHARPKDMTESEYIGKALDRCRRFARANGVAMWIVAHPKMQYKDKDGERGAPTPYDISGSANWFNKADNCFCVYRTADHVELHIQKIKFKMRGEIGRVDFIYDYLSGNYTEKQEETNGF